MGAVATYAIQLLGMMPALIQAGKDLLPLIKQGQNALSDMAASNRGPTPEDWALLNQMRDSLHAQMQA